MLKNTDNDVEKEALYLQEILSKDLEGLIIEPTKSAIFSNNVSFIMLWTTITYPIFLFMECINSWKISLK